MMLLLGCSIGGCDVLYNSSDCRRLSDVARDPAKVSYLIDWVDNRSNEMRKWEILTSRVRVTASENPKLIESLNINWILLGINKNYVSMSLNPYPIGNISEDARYKSIGFWFGRSAIFVTLSDGQLFNVTLDDLGLNMWPPQYLEQIEQIEDRVFVFCD